MGVFDFGTLKFNNEKEYYNALGAFCNSRAFSISYEPNKATGSYADAYRIRKLATTKELIEPIEKAIRNGNRINCNKYVKHILDKHNFVQNGKRIHGTLENVIKTVPSKYASDFIKGYTNSAMTDEKTIVVYEAENIKITAKSLQKAPVPKKRSSSSPRNGRKSFKTKHDYIKESIRNTDIGERGEKLVYEMEKEKLKTAVEKGVIPSSHDYPKWVSLDDDSLGYDILSYDIVTKSPIYIEVKTTTGGKFSPFYMSENEISFSKDNEAQYRLYRLYNLKNDIAKFFELVGDISKCAEVEIDAVNYLVSIK